jgi:hypothetical protein
MRETFGVATNGALPLPGLSKTSRPLVPHLDALGVAACDACSQGGSLPSAAGFKHPRHRHLAFGL